MKVLDRYILREFLLKFLGSLIFFTLLLLIVRFSEKEMSRFINWRMSVMESILSLAYQTPGYIVQVAPPSVLFATFFSLGRMAQNNEVTAMKAGGISLYRVFLPVFIGAFIITIFTIVFNDQVVTWANRRDSDIKEPHSSTQIARNVVFASAGDRVFYVDLMFMDKNQMQNVTIYDFDEDNNVRSWMYAERGAWAGAIWNLQDVIVRTFSGDIWYETPYEQKEITVNEDPKIMVKGARGIEEMSFFDLSRLIKYKKAAGQIVRRELVSRQSRISFPFACLIMAILGAPLFVMFGRSGTAVGFLITMSISFLYWGIAIAVFEAFGNSGKLPPILSCWTANVVFALVGLGFMFKVKK